METDTKQTQPSRFRFRVWDKEAGRMFSVRNIHPQDVDLMQSTGLTDCNGVEIFEGDVCEYTNGITDEFRIVYLLQGYLGWYRVHVQMPDCVCPLAVEHAENIRVVGTIYDEKFAHLRPEPKP